ncbi:leucyl aminopeptidase [Boudabousia tangfeifanii]|uniref:Probable cytosol aminopeptidase n=1 Tax=Boudabousia tangfeifanii TaxID=1912795 RepID=A0A1D9MKH5_9ACTO|nr:leucyl aminopeptidase [Boudabousia tangfeifanii]AOZ72786.1 leucyl aminopeptidase [Boudabousia tangfeifanii]
MTDFNLSTQNAAELAVDALVLAVSKENETAKIVKSSLSSEVISRLNEQLELVQASGKLDSFAVLPAPAEVAAKAIILTGIGKLSDLDAQSLRRAAGYATGKSKFARLAFDIQLDEADLLNALITGAGLGAYRFDAYKSEKDKHIAEIHFATGTVSEAEAKTALETAEIEVASTNLTRDLVNTPALDLYPGEFVERAKAAVADLPIECEVWDFERLQAEGCGGLVGVGRGSSRPPFLVKLSYRPAAAKSHIALIGKGITFDTGGISLKPATNMGLMKTDMGGAATVLGATVAAAKLELPVQIDTYLALAENMPGGNAQRPSDVLTMRNGVKVEVTNTDAEGRLVMADALSLAGETSAQMLVDVATLTGAAVVALGNRYAGVMGQGGLPAKVTAAAQAAGESFWEMPMLEEGPEANKSKVADIMNSSKIRAGGMMLAGDFLSNFVGDLPWAHIDIAGPAFNEQSQWGYTVEGATGAGVRSLVNFLRTL